MNRFIVGLDLGQSSDPTALCVLERSHAEGSTSRSPAYDLDVVHLGRFPLLTAYTKIVTAVRGLLQSPELQPDPVLAIDASGVGRAVVDLFLSAELDAIPFPITITAGSGPARVGLWNETGYRAFWVSKQDLVGTIQAALGHGRLKVVPTLDLADLLKRELLSFKMKLTASANETFGAWRDGDHDDLVLATALAAWIAENWAGPPTAPVGGESVTTPMVIPSRDERIWGSLGTGRHADPWHRR